MGGVNVLGFEDSGIPEVGKFGHAGAELEEDATLSGSLFGGVA